MKPDAFKKGLIKKIGKSSLAKIENVRVGLAGAGGLGSNCASSLVRVGFRKLTIVDFDKVEASNLDRQFYFNDQIGKRKVDALATNLLRINPSLELKKICEKINCKNTARLFVDCDVVVECLDRAEYKSMLAAELLPLGKFIVSVSGVGGIGASDEIKVYRLKKNFVLVGDLKSDISRSPALSPRVNVAAAKQADIVLEFVINKKGR